MGAGALGPQGNTGQPMMKAPDPSGGLAPAQPWSGMMPWQQGQASDGGIIGGTPMQKPWQQIGGWRQAMTPWGMLMPGMLPGMLAQREQGQAVQQPAAPAPGSTTPAATAAPPAPVGSPTSYGAATYTVAPGATPPSGLSATTQVGRATMPTAYQMAGNQAVAVDPLLDFWLSQIGSGAY